MKALLTIIILALVAWGIYALVNRDNGPAIPEATDSAAGGTQLDEREIKTFTVMGKPFSFTPDKITVKKGETVRIVFQNQEGTHDWVIDEFSARTKVLQAGQSETIEFYANKSGSFEYYCSVGNHRQMGMKGTLTVEE